LDLSIHFTGWHTPQVLLSVFRKEDCERGLFQKAIRIVVLGEGLESPVVNTLMIPRLFFSILSERA
jgi:hypothetical protein